MSPKTKQILRRIGCGYAAYHTLVAILIVASTTFEVNPASWLKTDFLLEMLFVLFVYPAFIPAVFVCGGLHDHCTTVLGYSVQTTVFFMMAACYVSREIVRDTVFNQKMTPVS